MQEGWELYLELLADRQERQAVYKAMMDKLPKRLDIDGWFWKRPRRYSLVRPISEGWFLCLYEHGKFDYECLVVVKDGMPYDQVHAQPRPRGFLALKSGLEWAKTVEQGATPDLAVAPALVYDCKPDWWKGTIKQWWYEQGRLDADRQVDIEDGIPRPKDWVKGYVSRKIDLETIEELTYQNQGAIPLLRKP